MVSFWVLTIIRHLIFRVPTRGDHNFDNHTFATTASLKTLLCLAASAQERQHGPLRAEWQVLCSCARPAAKKRETSEGNVDP